jgi:hypothetical protein
MLHLLLSTRVGAWARPALNEQPTAAMVANDSSNLRPLERRNDDRERTEILEFIARHELVLAER